MDANASSCSMLCNEVKLVCWLCFPVCVSVLAKVKFNSNYYALLKKLKQSFSRLSSKNDNREANTWSMHCDCGQQVESPWGWVSYISPCKDECEVWVPGMVPGECQFCCPFRGWESMTARGSNCEKAAGRGACDTNRKEIHLWAHVLAPLIFNLEIRFYFWWMLGRYSY